MTDFPIKPSPTAISDYVASIDALSRTIYTNPVAILGDEKCLVDVLSAIEGFASTVHPDWLTGEEYDRMSAFFGFVIATALKIRGISDIDQC
jgi:hypothetical protein